MDDDRLTYSLCAGRSEYSVEAVWHPAGKFFVVPGKDTGKSLSRSLPACEYASDQRRCHADIAIVSRESWQKTGAFADQKGHTGVSL